MLQVVHQFNERGACDRSGLTELPDLSNDDPIGLRHLLRDPIPAVEVAPQRVDSPSFSAEQNGQ